MGYWGWLMLHHGSENPHECMPAMMLKGTACKFSESQNNPSQADKMG